MMKKEVLILTVILFQISLVFSQRGKGGHQSSQKRNMSMPKFKAENAVHILRYNTEKITKKLKIKDIAIKNSVTKSIHTFNREVNEIKFLNAEKLNEITAYVNTKRSEAMKQMDREAMEGIMQKARKMLQPIKFQVKEKEKKLNTDLKEVLTEKQFKKWIKYQKVKKRALNSKGKKNTNDSRQKKMKKKGNGMRRGTGRRF